MEFQLHVILLIVCSVLFAGSWCWLKLNNPITATLALCVAFIVARLIALA